MISIESSQNNYKDTILIGIGNSGKRVLSKIFDGLKDARTIPHNLRTILLDVYPDNETNLYENHLSFSPNYWEILRPNFQEVEINLSQQLNKWEHWRWFKNSAPHYGRALGRMALFYDLKDGIALSKIWSALEDAYQELRSPVIRVIGTVFDDVSSGMLVDIIRLAQMAGRSNRAIQLWLVGPLEQEWSSQLENESTLSAREQHARGLATLRELSRFQYNQTSHFQWVPSDHPQDQLRQDYDYAVIQSVFIFQPRKGEIVNDVYDCMADTLITLLDQEVNDTLENILSASKARIEQKINNDNMGGMFHGLGCCALLKPTRELRIAMTRRMVREIMLDSQIGIYPIEELDFTRGQYNQLDIPAIPHLSAELQFEETNALIRSYLGKNREAQFWANVKTRMDNFLNRSEETNLGGVNPGGILLAEQWASGLSKALKRMDYPKQAAQMRLLHKQIENWINILKKEIYSSCVNAWEKSQSQLQDFQNAKSRIWLYQEGLEYQLYSKNIRAWEVPPENPSKSEALLQLNACLHWNLEFIDHAKWQLRLEINPADDVWQQEEIPDNGGFMKNQSQILQRLFKIAYPWTKFLERDASLALEKKHIHPLLQKSALRVHFNKSAATSIVKQLSSDLLVAVPHAQENLPAFQAFNGDPLYQGTHKVIKTSLPDRWVFLQVVDWIPFLSTEVYDRKAWKRYPVPGSTYVWPLEQSISKIEQPGEPFSAQFSIWLNRSDAFLQDIGKWYIYYIGRNPNAAWHFPNLESFDGASVGSYLRQLFSDSPPLYTQIDLKKFRQWIEHERSKTSGTRQQYLYKVEKELVKPLLNSQDEIEKEFAQLMLTIIKNERTAV